MAAIFLGLGANGERQILELSRASPGKAAATSRLGSITTDLARPLAGRFARNLIGGLMR